jgi:hypothetical protein
MANSTSKLVLPVTHFGHVNAKPKKWRDEQIEEIDDDDSELDETPDDVLKMLGFNPTELKVIDKHRKSHSSSVTKLRIAV